MVFIAGDDDLTDDFNEAAESQSWEAGDLTDEFNEAAESQSWEAGDLTDEFNEAASEEESEDNPDDLDLDLDPPWDDFDM
ncbi:hypothetical protein WKI13_15305 [Teredinibacter turnerae]|uniref:hypothetical protein n=1 Tax=Teredinibacter turnerae TaxID=2426 RepID=UPI00036D827A|nr:hypothetical protein [Teredinibacter turnerae]